MSRGHRLPSSTLSLTPSLSGKGRASGEGRKQGGLSHQRGALGVGKASRTGRFLSHKVSRRGLEEQEDSGVSGRIGGQWEESRDRRGEPG